MHLILSGECNLVAGLSVSYRIFCSFNKVVSTTKREGKAEWGAVNMLYQSKTLVGGEQELDVPEEHLDTEGGFEYKKILWLFKVFDPYFRLCFHVALNLSHQCSARLFFILLVSG